MDPLTQKARSDLMRRVKGKNTKPELAVRRLIHGLGYRYRLHDRRLPGSPDLVFRSRRKAIFVHGCFWHGHPGCKLATVPKTRTEFWTEKIEGNRNRDERALTNLQREGWETMVIWQCETKDVPALAKRIVEFLGYPGQAENRHKADWLRQGQFSVTKGISE